MAGAAGDGIALVAGVLIWSSMGNLIVRQKVPAFIITWAGCLIFKGLFWLVIHNSTIPIVQGGQANLYSVLTTFYLPPIVGYELAALIVIALIFATASVAESAPRLRICVEDRELVFLKLFLAAQLIFLFVVVTNKFHGIPLSAVILGLIAFAVYVLTTHTPFGRYLYAIGGNEGSCGHFRYSCRESGCRLV
jgi:D-xylose transport system permease protein